MVQPHTFHGNSNSVLCSLQHADHTGTRSSTTWGASAATLSSWYAVQRLPQFLSLCMERDGAQ